MVQCSSNYNLIQLTGFLNTPSLMSRKRGNLSISINGQSIENQVKMQIQIFYLCRVLFSTIILYSVHIHFAIDQILLINQTIFVHILYIKYWCLSECRKVLGKVEISLYIQPNGPKERFWRMYRLCRVS
jgi:hypothetical protein